MSRPLPCDEASRVRAFVINGLKDGPMSVGYLIEQAARYGFTKAQVELAGRLLGVTFHQLDGEIYWTRPEKIIPIWWSKRWFAVKGDRPAPEALGHEARRQPANH